jgi:hypothetical protein
LDVVEHGVSEAQAFQAFRCNLFRQTPARPKQTVPNKMIEVGSGTWGVGAPFSNIAPLLAVATQFGLTVVPSFKNATM